MGPTYKLQSALHESNSRGSSGCLDPGSVFGSSSLCVLLFWLLVSRVFSGSGCFFGPCRFDLAGLAVLCFPGVPKPFIVFYIVY